MHFFGDFEAVNNHIVAAAFVSVDGNIEEHWLMKPYPGFRRLEGVYARLLPYDLQDLISAPLLQRSAFRFKEIITRAENLWFYGPGDLRFFEDSFPNNDTLVREFSARYVDAKQLVEEILTPIYLRNTGNGFMVNIRNIVPYLEAEKINSVQEEILHNEMKEQIKTWEQLLRSSTPRLKDVIAKAKEQNEEEETEGDLSFEDITRTLNSVRQGLHPQTLLSRDICKDLRWLRTRLAKLQFSSPGSPRLIIRYLRNIDALLTIQGKRFTSGKVTLESMQELINEQHLPLEIVELFAEAELDREQSLEHMGKEIGLQTAALLLLGEEAASELQGEEHNALYDSRMLRLVILNCFQRYEHLQRFLVPTETC